MLNLTVLLGKLQNIYTTFLLLVMRWCAFIFCPSYEREEPFLALNLTVSNPSLDESLDQFVRGEILEGDNAYFCEKCNQKRIAIKRMCIKSLPPVLCIHLKRFSFDWEANKALKFDDYFKVWEYNFLKWLLSPICVYLFYLC